MAFIDGSVINIALPVLQKSLSATVTDSQWVVDAYLLVLASLLLAGGALGDHFGRMRMFAAGIVNDNCLLRRLVDVNAFVPSI